MCGKVSRARLPPWRVSRPRVSLAHVSANRSPAYPSTLLATAAVLTLVGAYLLLVWRGREVIRDLRESIAVVAELRPASTEADRRALAAYIGSVPAIKSESVKFVSRAEGAALLAEEFGENVASEGFDNPLYNLYTFNLRESAVTGGQLDAALEQLRARDEVLDVYVQDDVIRQLGVRVRSLAIVGLAAGLALLLAAGLLMANTTRLAVAARAQLIRNMELVGASWGFIAAPFLRRAAGLGAGAGILATALVYALWRFVSGWLPAGVAQPSWSELGLLAAGLTLFGLALNLAAAFFVVRKTLRLRGDPDIA